MFTVLRSSAGAGKTHALVKHYLRLCLGGENVAAYRQVLALTFTNKAATEMKERVLRYLEQLAKKDLSSPALRDVMDDLVARTGKSEAILAEDADRVLRHMLHHWGEVAISTIDAFTRRVVRPFARDLQLDHDLRMSTEHAWYQQRAVAATIAEAGLNEQVTVLLTEACAQLLEDEAPWNPALPLSELGKELDKESSIAPLAALHEMDAPAVLALTARLRKENGAFERAMQGIGREVLNMLEDGNLAVEDLANGKGGFHSFYSKLARFGGEWIEPGKNTLKAFEEGKFHSGKADAGTRATLEDIAPKLMSSYTEALAQLEKGQRDYFVRDAVLRELPSAFALIELDRHLRALKEADGVVFFSDLTRRVAEVVRDEPAPFIFERLGERYRHYLLDEFQDTSLLQWRTLLPLVHNALSTGGSALLVGDAKQAIYRWRNGEVRLFSELPKLFPPATTSTDREYEQALRANYDAAEVLAANRRSASTVIAFNNRLFGELSAVLSDGLRKVYDAHEQEVARMEPGLVRLERLPEDSTGEERDAALGDFLLRCVREAESDGFAPGDLAVLVRSAKEGLRMADRLTDAGYAVTSPDGLRLEGHPVAECLIDLLRVMHTSDRTAAARVLQHRARLSAPASTDHVDPFAPVGIGADPIIVVRAWLKQHGDPSLRTTLAELLTRLSHLLGAVNDAYLLTLLDEAHAFGVANGQDIGAFLEHWERDGKKRNTTPPPNARTIQVMTVHKAKGLEFPVVIMPNARMAPWRSHAERIWIAPGAALPELRNALVKKGAVLLTAGVPEVADEDELRALDDLDLLYVAFTRPMQRLYALVPAYRADPLTKMLLAHVDAHGRDGVLQVGERTGPWKQRDATASEAIAIAPGDAHPLAIRYEAPPEWDPADPDPLRRHGNAVHAVLGDVQHVKDIDGAVAKAVQTGALDAAAAHELRERLRALLTSEELAPWYGDQVHARTESSIIDAQGKLHRPDRVVFEKAVVRVLDIKTGAPNERHHDQVQRYMHLLAELGHVQVEGALLYIADGTLTPVAA